jgi:hypothetical protein
MRAKLSILAASLLAAITAAAQPASPPPTPAPRPAAAADDLHEHEAAPAGRESTLPWPRIEQLRRGNRVSEVRVTSASGEHRYTMVNREGRPPLSTQELSSGLSTPRFFKIEF